MKSQKDSVKKLQEHVIVGIDLAGKAFNPTGWALLRNRQIQVCQLFTTKEILARTLSGSPTLVAIDAPLALPKKNATREADRQMHKLGYPVFPPRFQSMKSLTLRAVGIAKKLKDRKSHVIEVHPTSTRKALGIPTKNWERIQEILLQLGCKGDIEKRTLTPHEIDAITAAFTADLHINGKTKLVGDPKEGYIVVPLKNDWKRLCP
jgi:predicted nuclease with RNAse H fold